MKLLFWSHVDLAHQTTMDKACHNDPQRMSGLYSGFHNLGWEVDVVTMEPKLEDNPFTMKEGLRRVHINNLKAKDYDVVFFFPNLPIVSLLELLCPVEERWRFKRFKVKNKEELKKIANHPNIFVRLDVPYESYGDRGWKIMDWVAVRARVVGIYTHLGLKLWSKDHPGVKTFLSLNATIADPPPSDNPYPDNGRKKGLWVGRLPQFHFAAVDTIASKLPEMDIYVISGKIYDYDGGYHDPRETDPILFKEKMEKTKGIFRSKNIVYLGGLSYGNTFSWMNYADFCIGLAVRKDQTASSGKIWEYWCQGTPVVMDNEVPESWVKSEIDCGEICKYLNSNDFAEKVRILVNRKFDRKALREYIQKNHTWKVRAKKWDDIIRGELNI